MAKHPLADRYIQARNYTRTSGRNIRLIVIHDMEAPESARTAENVGAWFAGPTAPQASTHFNLDSDSIVQNVDVRDVAWAAPGANHDGIQFEHAGYAKQSLGEWLDAYGIAMLDQSARLAASLCREYGIPVRRLTVAQLRGGAKGFIGHVDATNAYRLSDHNDPGAGFPWAWYLARVNAHLNGQVVDLDRKAYLRIDITPKGKPKRIFIGWTANLGVLRSIVRDGLKPTTACAIAWRGPGRTDTNVWRGPRDVRNVARTLLTKYA